jgi:hypothetical protein
MQQDPVLYEVSIVMTSEHSTKDRMFCVRVPFVYTAIYSHIRLPDMQFCDVL